MITPPMMNASATGTAWNRYALMYFEKQQAQDRGRDEGDDEVAVELEIRFEEARAVFPDDGQHRAGLDHDVEHVPALVVRPQQVAGEDQVPGARDGQELGEPLHDAEEERVQEESCMARISPDFCCTRRIGRRELSMRHMKGLS